MVQRRRTVKVKVERSPATIISPQRAPISSSSTPSSSRVSSSRVSSSAPISSRISSGARNTRPLPTQSTTTSVPRCPPGSRPSDSVPRNPPLTPLPPMLHPPAMVYNEGRQEPRLSVGPPVSLDLAIRQRVTQNVIFEAHLNGIRATDTTLYQAGTIGQLHGGGYSSLAANPYQDAQDTAGRMHWNPIAAGGVPGDNVRRLPVLAPYVWPQREHVQLFADVRPPDRCMPMPDAVYYSRDDLHDKRTREIEDGGGTETKITQKNSPATVGDASAKENHAVKVKTDAEIALSQEKITGSAQVLVVTEKPTANIYLINQFPSEANTSGTSASASRNPSAPPRNTTMTPPSSPFPHQSINPQEVQSHPSVSPRTTTAITTLSAPSSHSSVHPQEEPERPPPATTTATDDDVHILAGAEALQAQRNEELENNFQAFHGFPPRRLSLDKIVAVKREAGEEEEKGELQGERGGSSGEDEMEVCSD